MISIRGVRKRFGSHEALAGVDLEVPQGSVQGLLGPNGAGKTTTVRVLTTLLDPDEGDAFVAGHSVRKHGDRVRRSLGLSGQYAAVDERLTGFENLVLVGELYGMRRRAARERASELLREFRLDDVPRGKRAGAYSGGMRRRLDLAGAIVARPPVVILDEPTTGLDPRGRRDTWNAVDTLTRGGTTVLLTTQYLEEADELADSIAVIDAGRIVAEGTAAELKARAGGSRIEVRLQADSDAVAASRAIGGVIAGSVYDARSRTIRAAAPEGLTSLRSVVEALAVERIEVLETALRQPTLDDVFLRLTGTRGAEEAEETTEVVAAEVNG